MMPSLDALRARLEADRIRLRNEIAELAEQPAEYRQGGESFYGDHLADDATDTFEEEKALALEAHLVGLLGKVEDALNRFENGTYGRCTECGQAIDPDRLEALPYATTCLTCASPTRKARA